MENDSKSPPLQIRIRNLETGMVIAKPVYTRDGCTLLQEGTRLSTKNIDRLNQWNQRYVYVHRESKNENSGSETNGFARAS